LLDLIYKHPVSGGEIYQSGAMEIPGIAKSLNTHGYIHCEYVVEGLEKFGIDILALTAKGFQPAVELGKTDTSTLEVIHIPFADDQDMPDHKVAQMEKMIESASEKLKQAVERGQKVLSTCWAGINRSSLLTAFTLLKLTNDNPQAIIKLIRTQRAKNCLNNVLFERIVIHGF